VYEEQGDRERVIKGANLIKVKYIHGEKPNNQSIYT
jgi:hypothetical protein